MCEYLKIPKFFNLFVSLPLELRVCIWSLDKYLNQIDRTWWNKTVYSNPLPFVWYYSFYILKPEVALKMDKFHKQVVYEIVVTNA